MKLEDYVRETSYWRKWQKANEEAVAILTALESGEKDIESLVKSTGLDRKVISHRLSHLRRKGLVEHVECWKIQEQ